MYIVCGLGMSYLTCFNMRGIFSNNFELGGLKLLRDYMSLLPRDRKTCKRCKRPAWSGAVHLVPNCGERVGRTISDSWKELTPGFGGVELTSDVVTFWCRWMTALWDDSSFSGTKQFVSTQTSWANFLFIIDFYFYHFVF